jgi:hypothetical protein
MSFPLTLSDSLIEASLIIITGTLPTMRLFLLHIAPGLFGEPEPTRTWTTHRDNGWELQHRETHGIFDVEDGSSQRRMLPTKSEAS